MKKMWHLSSCSTCRRILQETQAVEKGFVLQDIKSEAITPVQLDKMKSMAGSYEALFSRKSRQYRGRGLQDQSLTEQDYRRLILEEYTFLKRPVVIAGGKIFVGNDKKTTEIFKTLLEDT